MAYGNNHRIQGFVFWDSTGNLNPIAAYQAVALATAAEVAAAVAAGVGSAKVGQTVVQCPSGSSVATRRVVGVTAGPAVNGGEVSVITDGVAEVMVNAAVALDSRLTVAATATRTSAQTPLTNLPESLLPGGEFATVTYNFALADDTAITPATGGANALYNYLGFALEAATAQYDVIPVQLALVPFYA